MRDAWITALRLRGAADAQELLGVFAQEQLYSGRTFHFLTPRAQYTPAECLSKTLESRHEALKKTESSRTVPGTVLYACTIYTRMKVSFECDIARMSILICAAV